MATAKRRCFSFLFLLGILVGTTAWAEPIGIATIEDLQKIGNDPAYPLDGHYVLTQNIDASDTRNWNEGAGFKPIGANVEGDAAGIFNGILDGQGYSIAHLAIGQGYNISNLNIGEFHEAASALFLCVGDNAEVKHLGLLENSVAYNESLGTYTLGGIAAVNKGTITACYTTGGFRSNPEMNYSGNLVGYNQGTISQCCAIGGSGGEGGGVGGLVGVNTGLIKQCYAIGHVCEESSVGGLVGYNRENGTIEECYAVAALSEKVSARMTHWLAIMACLRHVFTTRRKQILLLSLGDFYCRKKPVQSLIKQAQVVNRRRDDAEKYLYSSRLGFRHGLEYSGRQHLSLLADTS